MIEALGDLDYKVKRDQGCLSTQDEGKAMRGSGPENALVATNADARRLIDDVVETLLSYG